MSIKEITETKKLPNGKVLESKKLLGCKIKTYDGATHKWEEQEVDLELPAFSKEKEMDEKWMQSELVALRSTVNVALTTANRAEADISSVKSEMLHPKTGKRLWDGIEAEKLVVQQQEAMDVAQLAQRVTELEQTVDQLLDLVQKLVEKKVPKESPDNDTFQELLKKIGLPSTTPIGPSPSTPLTPMTPYPTRNGKSTFGGPYYQGPTLFSDVAGENKVKA